MSGLEHAKWLDRPADTDEDIRTGIKEPSQVGMYVISRPIAVGRFGGDCARPDLAARACASRSGPRPLAPADPRPALRISLAIRITAVPLTVSSAWIRARRRSPARCDGSRMRSIAFAVGGADVGHARSTRRAPSSGTSWRRDTWRLTNSDPDGIEPVPERTRPRLLQGSLAAAGGSHV